MSEKNTATVYTIRVNMTPMSASTRINVEGSTIKSYYMNEVVASEAVISALAAVAQRIARKEIDAGDGFTVKVEFVTVPPDKEKP
jgi:hypothetical protein